MVLYKRCEYVSVVGGGIKRLMKNRIERQKRELFRIFVFRKSFLL